MHLAFSVPPLNRKELQFRYQWPVLPQDMINFPTMYQYYVGKALKPVKQAFPQAYIISYMDDIPLATSKKKGL